MRRTERWWLRLHPLTAGIDRRVPVEWVVKRAMVSVAHRYCYCRIPKCANSTVIKTLAHHDPRLAARAGEATLARLKQSGGLFRARAWSPRSLARRYFCFTVVRHPHTRLLSAYLDKIAAAGPGQYARIAAAAGRPGASAVTFAEFVAFLEQGGLHDNAHWAPQVSLLPVAPGGLSFIGRVETLEADLERLLRQLPLGTGYDGMQSREDRRRHSGERLEGYYTPDLVARVARLYTDDFRAFGYAPDRPGASA